jgi:hypothetical protein
MRTWIAAASIALTVAAPALRAQGQCDPEALLSACAATAATNASFVDLMSEGSPAGETSTASFASDAMSRIAADAPEALSRPAVYMGAQPAVALPAATGFGAWNAAGTGFADAAVPRWLGLPTLATQPAPSFAWMLALGFLGVIVLRRTRPFGY